MNRIFLMLALALGVVATTQAQITAPIETETPAGVDPNAKYLAPIPEENGMVYLVRELELPQDIKADETFEKMKAWVDRCMKDKRIISSQDLQPEEPYTVQMMVRQEIIFSSSMFATDKCEYHYVLDLSLQANKLVLKMRRINFRYNGDNPDRKMLRRAGEDYISDRVALNKKKDKLIFGYRKFRINTIDLMDEYAASLKTAFLSK